jgi:iron complex outermembrane recepter protein
MHRIRGILLASALMPFGSQALAQTQPAPTVTLDAAPSDAATEAAVDQGEIVVTGTRLQNGGFLAPTPVTVLGQQTFEQRAPSSVSDVVNDLPAFRQTATNTQNQRGNGNGGQNRVDLRGLGSERTLVLVDGRRHVPTNLTGTLDTNMIPTPLVERIEVVTGGASAAYGSDAVSGVVNFILKDHVEGVHITAQSGISQQGDNSEQTVSFSTGATFADGRGKLVVGGDWSQNKGVSTLYSRDWGRKQPCLFSYGALAARGSNPAQGYANNCTYSQQSDGGLINAGPLRGIAFDTAGNPMTIQFGTVYSNLMVGGNLGPDANPFGNWNIRAPSKRLNGLVKASFDLSDAFSVYVQGGFGRMRNQGLSSYHQAPSLIVPITNPFIPQTIKDRMVALGLQSITVGRYETQLGGYKLLATNDVYRLVGGVKGDLGGSWKVDAYYEMGRTNGHQLINTNIFEGNYLAATYVVQGPNGPVCGPLATNPNMTAARAAQVLPGCVPFNIFGRTAPSQAAKDYITYRGDNQTHYEQDVASASISGSPFETWAGPVSVAAGFEHRKETAFSLADPYGQQVVALSNNGSTYSGAVTVNEGFAEVGVPLIKDASFTKSLDLNGAVRRTHYSTSGSVTTWKLGTTWEPTDWLRLRVTRSRDIRAANITELFQTRAIGITASFLNPINNKTGPINTISGGNPNLKPEIAKNWTAGAVLQPKGALEGLRLSVDYFNVDISNVIATVAAADIARRCANGLQEYCALIVFDNSASGISTIQQTPANLNRLKTDGFDIEAAYRLPIGRGRLDLRSLTTYTRHLTTIDAVSNIDRAGTGALGGVPHWVNNTSLSYNIDGFTNTFQLKYTSPIRGDATLIGPDDPAYNPALSNSINVNHFPAAAYLNWTLQYDVKTGDNRTFQIFGIVNNVFDKDPADYAIVAFASGGNPYDVVGRTYKVGVRVGF